VKPCPFCAEPIQEAAIKCRFCGSMLDGSETPRPAQGAATPAHQMATSGPPRVIFDGAPSWKAWFWSYVFAGILSIALVGLVWIAILNWMRKSRKYRVTERNIDYEVGMLSKRIETLQLWRVHDLDFSQSFVERMLGIARIQIFTKDVTDPVLVLKGLPASRDIFDQLKDAAELARQQRVIGIVE
jgi:membrane protein YdbS with pleckstrin-like domain